jgi:hypothetical protein
MLKAVPLSNIRNITIITARHICLNYITLIWSTNFIHVQNNVIKILHRNNTNDQKKWYYMTIYLLQHNTHS